MRKSRIAVWSIVFLVGSYLLAQEKPKATVIQTSIALDGKGSVLRNVRIVIEDSKIKSVEPGSNPLPITTSAA